MTIQTYGDIPVTQLSAKDLAKIKATTSITLGQDPYKYAWMSIAADAPYQENMVAKYCIYVLETPGGVVTVNGIDVPVDHFALGDATSLTITVTGGPARLLVASQPVADISTPLAVTPLTAAKRVDKPWGHEIWLTGDPSTVFAFKRISLQAGNKTSLQYHRYKRETNFVISGTAALHYNPDPSVPPDQFIASATAAAELTGPFVADVFPDLIHRLEALTDLLLYEVSTPELDDVIRLADDAARSSGRIAAEHLRAV